MYQPNVIPLTNSQLMHNFLYAEQQLEHFVENGFVLIHVSNDYRYTIFGKGCERKAFNNAWGTFTEYKI